MANKFLIIFVTLAIGLTAKAGLDCFKADPEKEYQNLLRDPKWSAFIKSISDNLDKEHIRNCSQNPSDKGTLQHGLKTFADDVEFVGSEKGQMFELLFKNYNASEVRGKSELPFVFEKNNMFMKLAAISMKIKTPKGTAIALVNSCSVKEIFAYLAPTVELALKANCGTNPAVRGRSIDAEIKNKALAILQSMPNTPAAAAAAAPAPAEGSAGAN